MERFIEIGAALAVLYGGVSLLAVALEEAADMLSECWSEYENQWRR